MKQAAVRKASGADRNRCRICGENPRPGGERVGRFRVGHEFRYLSCPSCRYSFVANPWLDFERIYSHDYYAGKGADPLVDYLFELHNPDSCIRKYEWRGISRIARAIMPECPQKLSWLDYGCGNGGLIRYVRKGSDWDCQGFEEGSIAMMARDHGIPILSPAQLGRLAGTFDLVTAIEVIEHVADPIPFLQGIRALMKPNGVLFLTTGNARPWRERITQWSYAAVPEVHISFFEPETLAIALQKAGFRPVSRGYLPGFTDVIKFKVLKNLRLKTASKILDLLPWSIISRLVDLRHGVSKHPIGIAV